MIIYRSFAPTHRRTAALVKVSNGRKSRSRYEMLTEVIVASVSGTWRHVTPNNNEQR